MTARKNPWLYERNGALNPAWLLLCVMLGTLCFVTIIAFVLRLGEPVEIAGFSSVTVSVNILAICGVSQNKAAILANANSSGAIAKGITGSIIEHEDRA